MAFRVQPSGFNVQRSVFSGVPLCAPLEDSAVGQNVVLAQVASRGTSATNRLSFLLPLQPRPSTSTACPSALRSTVDCLPFTVHRPPSGSPSTVDC